MRMIIAIVREEKIDQVRQALIDAEITRITVSRVSGHGRSMDAEIYRGNKVMPNLVPKMKIEIAVNDAFVKITVDAIIKAARSDGEGKVGDGKIFIQPLENASASARVRPAERPYSRQSRVEQVKDPWFPAGLFFARGVHQGIAYRKIGDSPDFASRQESISCPHVSQGVALWTSALSVPMRNRHAATGAACSSIGSGLGASQSRRHTSMSG
jgi:nitrogen regulatory protein P-II 1